jgi:hypothetical protein
MLLALAAGPGHADSPRSITIDGNFADWAAVPAHVDPAHNEHDTSHKCRLDKPDHIEHADVDLLEYKLAHDAENLYAYFRARGIIGRTQRTGPGKLAGRYYAILTIDLDRNEKTGYWLHEGGFYPTSGGYDVNAEIEWYDGRMNTGHYINHACRDQAELDQAYLDQSAGHYQKGNRGPYPPGFVRFGLGSYRFYTEWVYFKNDALTFVRDKAPQTLGIITGALSADGHKLEMKIPFKGLLVDTSGKPLLTLGRAIHVSMSLEASGELAAGGQWASNTGEPIRNYLLEPPKQP